MSAATHSPGPVVSWIDEEPGWEDALRELRCVQRRVRKRWPLALVLTVVLTVVAAYQASRKQHIYESTVVMRVVEEFLDPTTSPPTSNDIKTHITQVALSRNALLAIAEEFRLYTRQRTLDPSWGEQLMRDAIELSVYEDDFRFVTEDDNTRTVRIAVTFAAADPEVALQIARRLGQFIGASQMGERQAWSASIARDITESVEQLNQDFLRLRQREAELSFDQQENETPAQTEVELRRVRAEIAATESELRIYQSKAAMFRLRSDFETQERGLRFELVDPGELAQVHQSSRERIVIYTCLAFLLILPLVGLAVGTFDSRARDSDGLRRIGVLPLGEVQAFEGMECGAWMRREVASRGGT